jgi:hypothetical protein
MQIQENIMKWIKYEASVADFEQITMVPLPRPGNSTKYCQTDYYNLAEFEQTVIFRD